MRRMLLLPMFAFLVFAIVLAPSKLDSDVLEMTELGRSHSRWSARSPIAPGLPRLTRLRQLDGPRLTHAGTITRMATPIQRSGYRATGTGSSQVVLEIDGATATLVVSARWMGSPSLEVVLRCEHRPTGDWSGALHLVGADGHELPPSPDPLLVEYVVVPEQPIGPGSEELETNQTFTHVVWLHPQSVYDDGTQLGPEEYDVPIARFATVARALAELEAPWKLGVDADR